MAACGQAEVAGLRDGGEQRDIAQVGSGHCFDIRTVCSRLRGLSHGLSIAIKLPAT